jgi:polyisoprenoid-binding protein YceI
MRSIALAASLLVLAAAARADDFTVTPGKPNLVVFTSKAQVESFQGKTSKLSGRISVNPADVGDSITVELHVDLASLDTGIAKRNGHMRDNHLETSKYPEAVFTGATVLSPAHAALSGKPVGVDLEGSFTIHGMTHRMRPHADVTLNGNKLAFTATFQVSLADYAIPRPQFLFLKLADTQELKVTGVAVRAK